MILKAGSAKVLERYAFLQIQKWSLTKESMIMKLTEKEDGIHKLLENPVTNERPGILVSEVTDGSRK